MRRSLIRKKHGASSNSSRWPALPSGARTSNPNFEWSRDRYAQFVYVDRVFIDKVHREQGLYITRQFYQDLFSHVDRSGPRFAEGLSKAGYAVLNDVVLNQVLVSFGDADATNKIIAAIQQEGTCWCGGTLWQGQTAMRISVSSWATTEKDVEKSLAAMLRVARRVIHGEDANGDATELM